MRPTHVLAAAAGLALALPAATMTSAGAHPPSSLAAKPHHHHHTAPFGISLGQVGTGACNAGSAPAAVVIDTGTAGTATYVAPADGVLTSFSHQANGVAGQVRALVFKDGPTSGQGTVVARSDQQTVITNALNTFAIRLPIKKGQRLGLGYTVNNMACATAAGYAADSTWIETPFDADTTTAFVGQGHLSAGPGVTFRPNISAVLESDVDGDGWGDLTQDGCIQSKKVTATCPNTKVGHRPKHVTTRTKARVRMRFTSTVAGSTFECRVDGHQKWRKCATPYKKRFGPGEHTVQVRAVSPAGIADPKPVKLTFTIKRSR